MKYSISIFIVFILLTYIFLYVCDYINKNDNQNINCSIPIKVFLSIVNSILANILFIKYGLSIYSIMYVVAWTILFITSYIDYSTKYIYEITSKPLLVISSILFMFNLVIGVTNLRSILWLVISLLIVVIFGKFNYIGKGDIDIYLALMISLTNFKIAIILLIFSLGISGIASICLLLIKRVSLNYRKPLCPSIALASYILLILV
ncbi:MULTISPECIES: hypothetical protein [Clostridium]|uniref:hypothetical protein n=1 Tax=Clostridium TaxID=1485 RepID=UPI001897A4E0|nr:MULTISPECIES: hypothetical protein [Clostridium]MDI9215845.1 hypothetical protein [Clostridium tertium]